MLLTTELEMVDSPMAMCVLRPSNTWSVVELCVIVASLMVTMFFAVAQDAELLNESREGASSSIIQLQPVTVKAPMSKFSISITSLVMALPVSVTSPAVMSVKVPGWIRCIEISPAVMVSRTAFVLEGPLPVCEVPPGTTIISAVPKSASMRIMLSIAKILTSA